MATATIILPIEGGSHDDTNPAQRDYFNSKPRLLFADDGLSLHHYTFRVPANFASALTLKAIFAMTSDTTNNVAVSAAVMAITPGTTEVADSDSYDTINTSVNTAVPTTLGATKEISLTLSNADSMAIGDWLAVRVGAPDATASPAVGDLEMMALSLEYTTT